MEPTYVSAYDASAIVSNPGDLDFACFRRTQVGDALHFGLKSLVDGDGLVESTLENAGKPLRAG